MTSPWSLHIPSDLMARLQGHLFPGDGDEHGAVIAAGMAESPRGTRLLARDVVLARDGIDYVPGKRGYRMLTASFVTENILRCASDGLVYLAVHCHGGSHEVGFSGNDLASHERGYPALLDLADGLPVGGLVFANNAVAGDIWLPGGRRIDLEFGQVVDRPIRILQPRPSLLIVEYLARLGVGHLIIVDPERIELSNLPRVVGSTRWDAMAWLTAPNRPDSLRRLGERLSRRKTAIAAGVAHHANRRIHLETVTGDIADPAIAERLTDCDFLFLAADSMRARLVFNALVHQYLIPGAQVGAKVTVDKKTGQVVDVFSVYRPVFPGSGCL